MAVVTGLVASSRKDGRFDLAVDGRQLGVVSLEVIERLSLRVGAVVDDAPDGALCAAIATLAAYDRALNMLAAQPRSARDLRRRLVQKGESPANADAAIERLEAAGLLNDGAYARQFARSRVLGAGHSRRRVQQELFRRGVARAEVDDAVEEVFDDEGVEETALAEAAARKKLRGLGSVDAETRRRRLYSFLVRRGYDGDTIRAVMSSVLAASEFDGLEQNTDGLADL
jgi:regulatory protein